MRITVKPEVRNNAVTSKSEVRNNAMTSVMIKPYFYGAYHHRFHSKHKKGTL